MNIKSQFPIFKHHPDLVYLDNAATTQKPQTVIDSMIEYYSCYNANIHRGSYTLGEQATKAYEDARGIIAQFIGAQSDEIVFVKNTTEGINLVASSWGLQHLKAGDSIVVTEYEHHANMLPWQRLAPTRGATLSHIPVDALSRSEAIDQYITQNTRLVACTALSHVTGAYIDVSSIVKAAHAVGAKVLLDAAQLVAHEKIDVKKLDVDFMVFSGHKLFGPTGIGVLYIKKPLGDQMVPYQVGGGTVFSVDWHETEYGASPHKFEAGTPPIAQAIGLAAAINWLNKQDMSNIKTHETVLMNMLYDGLSSIPGVCILGGIDRHRGPILSFTVDGHHAHDVAAYLNQFNIAVRAGNHCAQPLAKHFGVDSSVRVSVACYNTCGDVKLLIDKVKEICF